MNVDLIPGIDALRPESVRDYLLTHGWVRDSAPREGVTLFRKADGSTQARARLVEDTSYEDFTVRMAELVDVLSALERRSFLEVLDDLLLPPGDRLRFRFFSDVTRAGTIPLDDSIRIRSAQKQLLLASAHSALEPRRHFARLSQKPAVELLGECRETLAERGSYISSILVPVPVALTPTEVEDPYARRVTRTLVGALLKLDAVVSSGALGSLLSAEKEGVSANLLESLSDLRPSGERSFLEVDVQWLGGRALPFGSRTRVKFAAGVFNHFKEAARELRSREPLAAVEVEGYVIRLERAEPANKPGGVTIAAQIEALEQQVPVRVQLPAQAYAEAISAHRDGQRVRVVGTLVREGRSHRLSEPSGFQVIPAAD